MFSENRVFQIALLISLFIHGAILFQTPNFNLNIFPQNKQREEVKVSYIKSPVKPKQEQKPTKSEPLLKLPPRITIDKRIPPPYVDKENIFKANQLSKPQERIFEKPSFVKADILAIKKKITLPPIDMNKINNPSYLSYYQIVREKIKRAAYQNYTGEETGEVTISFIISSDGSLRDLRLIEEKSSPSSYLREIALKSVKDASAFPSFPKELDYPQLSFNLAITFEIE